MHILEIPSFFPPYGGLFCLDQAKALKSLGHEVRILSNVQLGATIGLRDYIVRPYLRFEHEMADITVYQSYQRGIPKMVRLNVRRWVSIVCSMYQDYEKKYGRPDILHAHCTKWAGYAAMKISQQYHIPYVITEHLAYQDYAFELGEPPSHCWQIPLLKESLYNATCVVPVSKEVVADLSGFFGHDYRWKAISNMIDTDFFGFYQRKPRQERPFRFCCLGIFVERKGYDVLFKAFQRLKSQNPEVELHIAGRGTDSVKCRQMLRDMKLEGCVKTHGELDKNGVRDLLYLSDTLVLATRGETQGLALLEALSTGIPVVTTEAIPESVRPPIGCTFVPIDDVEALAEAMKNVMIFPADDGSKLSESARQIASPETIARQIEKLFSEILASK